MEDIYFTGPSMDDLFEAPPAKVKKILDKYNMDDFPSYPLCEKLELELSAIDYTFDWGLDGIPFNLRKIEWVDLPKKGVR